jgi:Ca2+-binding EF-hand superfamily protein
VSRYADYKLNGKAITQQDFTIIFDTFSRTSSGMADLMFGMYDQDRSGSLAFDGLARALAVFLKGTYEEKVELCFQLLDTDNDSHITRNDLVSMLKYLPMQRIKRQNDALLGSSMMGNGKDLQLRTLEEEEVCVCVSHLQTAMQPSTVHRPATSSSTTRLTNNLPQLQETEEGEVKMQRKWQQARDKFCGR